MSARANAGAVSIPQWCDCCNLKGAPVCNICMFQSHNGAIAARSNFKQNACLKFQSHNGAIAASVTRLLDSFRWLFQSHNGAIAARQRGGGAGAQPWFQSHNGAIAAKCFQTAQFRPQLVSIPQWCDCCKEKISANARHSAVSIPQWCDCC